MEKTNIHLHLYNLNTCDSLISRKYIWKPREHILWRTICCRKNFLDQKPSYDFIDLKWDTLALSLKDLDLPMPDSLQIPRWKKAKVRKLSSSNNSYFRIVDNNPNTRKVRPITDVYNLQDKTLSANSLDLDNVQLINVVQLEVVVTDEKCTMTLIVNQCTFVKSSSRSI